MPIANYTTKIAPDTTIGQIGKMLSAFGAKRIITDYDEDGNVSSLQFMLQVKTQMVFFLLPCNAEGVLRSLERDSSEKKYRNIDHARGVAWRIIHDWIRAQLAIVDAGQAKMDEVFLPYALSKNGQTLYSQVESGSIKLLTQ